MTQKSLLQSAGDGSAVQVGCVGEEQRQSTVLSAATGFTNGIAKNITSSPIVLNPGVWEISCNTVFHALTGDTMTVCVIGVSTTSATQPSSSDAWGVPDSSGQIKFLWTGSLASNGTSLSISPYRINISSQTTLYFVGTATHTGGTFTISGSIKATRIA